MLTVSAPPVFLFVDTLSQREKIAMKKKIKKIREKPLQSLAIIFGAIVWAWIVLKLPILGISVFLIFLILAIMTLL
ncbi:hypothetical protein AUQ39_00830 [Lacticaseibacillus casei]|nr:hypothetical protein AUQ39_00830 [Lacticaseibacillus casei]